MESEETTATKKARRSSPIDLWSEKKPVAVGGHALEGDETGSRGGGMVEAGVVRLDVEGFERKFVESERELLDAWTRNLEVFGVRW